ncbi:unnamed protein product [Eruca vesicaria subsp. sativa]|uniref:Uncharacterized protein n=1 Tax=Eruca vesicaria subsp. sativa TaxID=29727 RepID=A0ABC8LCN7_ERUVS|nr:unnamed protein product [Eruca vesicaria subsp. sativa]
MDSIQQIVTELDKTFENCILRKYSSESSPLPCTLHPLITEVQVTTLALTLQKPFISSNSLNNETASSSLPASTNDVIKAFQLSIPLFLISLNNSSASLTLPCFPYTYVNAFFEGKNPSNPPLTTNP